MCSGSLDYLQGGPFAFVAGLDAVGAWPPMRESHVEMDAAWALYEAWVAIQTGEVDSALVYGFGKSSPGDLHEIMALQTDPYYVLPLWPSMVDMAALQASAYLDASGRDREATSPRSRPARSATRRANPNAVRKGDVDAPTTCSQQPVTHHPLRDADIAPITDGTAAVVIAAGDLARSVCEAAGVDPRHRAPHRGAQPRRARPHDVRVDHAAAAARPGVGERQAIDVAELHAQFSHEELILAEALGLDGDTAINPSGGPLASNPVMSAGLIRIGEVARRITTARRNRGVAHATSGPCLQQNLVVRPGG